MTRYSLTTLAVFYSLLSFSQRNLTVGHLITGDFNGDGRTDTAFVKQTFIAKTKAKSWTLMFSDKTIPGMQLGCCDLYLVNEGDLNKDKATEISIFQAPENGCVYVWTTYSLKNNRWTKFIQPFLIATDCEHFKPEELRNRVFKENGKVYYWDVDPNDDANQAIKKQVTIK